MVKLKITDNARQNGEEGWSLERCCEFPLEEQSREQTIRDLSLISGKRLKDVVAENPNLLVFPPTLGAHQDGVENLHICSYSKAYNRVYTGNLMGFIGVNDTQMSITSRFAKGDEDFFLHYMLIKVFCPNIFDLKHETSKDAAFDFLLYLFPHYFNEAMKQGLFKMYRNFERNDSKINGTIDIPRHIRNNIPFKGTIAYRTREFSFDNPITQLIRHTIEFLKTSPIGRSFLVGKDTQDNIRLIVDNTSSYCYSDRRKVIASNHKELRHPYFTKYTVLQKLCISILRHEELKYGSNKDKIHGILFDGAWLWEEYLNTLLKPLGIYHAENKTGKNPIYLFEGNKYVRYPDFFLTNTIIIDAKYKHLGHTDIARDDIHQIISYLHVLDANGAYLAHPIDGNHNSCVKTIGTLNGMRGEIGLIELNIPQNINSMDEFCKEIVAEENGIINELSYLMPR
ncbi:McrC family protein [Coprobacter sp.]|uniref:McrC family protein n=1 Tax=Coprobacter sp. TaxID=1941478 RepID=UPI003AB39B82